MDSLLPLSTEDLAKLDGAAVTAVPFIRTKMPKVNGFNKFPMEQRIANIKAAYERGLPEISALINEDAGFEAVIIGGGPSVNDQLETIRKLKANHARIICIERMYDWCWNHDLRPDYVVTMDASDNVTDSFHNLHPGSTHLVASQCQPAVFERLKQMSVFVFSTPQNDTEMDIETIHKLYEDVTVVNGGGSVVLCAMGIAMLLGMRKVHMFGFDCHTTKGDYALGIAGTGEPSHICYASVGGRRYRTTMPFLCFAQQFIELHAIAKQEGVCDFIKIYGDSLVSAMSKEPVGA